MADTDRRGRPTADGTAATRGPNRVLLVVAAVLVTVAALVAVFAADRAAHVYDPATPEGTAHAYLTAVLDGDREEAVRHLAADGRCTITDLDRAYVGDDLRIALREVQVTGDTARVDIDVAMPSGDLFGGEETFEKHTLRMTRASGTWLLTGEPWPMSGCGKPA